MHDNFCQYNHRFIFLQTTSANVLKVNHKQKFALHKLFMMSTFYLQFSSLMLLIFNVCYLVCLAKLRQKMKKVCSEHLLKSRKKLVKENQLNATQLNDLHTSYLLPIK